MNRTGIFLIYPLFFLVCNTSFAQNWEIFDQFPGSPRDDGSSFTIGEKVYCGLGRDNGFNCTRDFFIFDKSNDSWINGESLPVGSERQYASGFSWNGKGYIFGGVRCDGVFLNDLWEYDEVLNSWTQLLSLPSDGRGGMQTFIIQDSLYIIGGKNQNGILKEVWCFDLTSNTWNQKNDLPNDGIWRGTSFAFNGFGYIGLGKNNLMNQTGHNPGFFKYDPTNDSWLTLTDPGLMPRSYPGTVQADNLVLFFGGLAEDGSILNTFDRLDISSWLLQSLPAFESEPRKGGICFLDGNVFYNTTGISLVQRYNESWRTFNTLSVPDKLITDFCLYPNPAQKLLFISLSSVSSGELKLFSSLGQQITSFQIDETKNVSFDISFLENGIYYMNLNGSTVCFSVEK